MEIPAALRSVARAGTGRVPDLRPVTRVHTPMNHSASHRDRGDPRTLAPRALLERYRAGAQEALDSAMSMGERCRCGEPPAADSLVCPRCGRDIFIRSDFRLERSPAREPWLFFLISVMLVGSTAVLQPSLLRLLLAAAGLLTLAEVLAVVWSGTLGVAVAGSLLALYAGAVLEPPFLLIGLVLGAGSAVIGVIGRLMVVSRRTYIRRARLQLELLGRLLGRDDRPS